MCVWARLCAEKSRKTAVWLFTCGWHGVCIGWLTHGWKHTVAILFGALGGGGETGFGSRIAPLQVSDIARGGTTTVVGLRATDDVTRSMAGLLAHTRALRHGGLTAYCMTGGYHLPPVTLMGNVRDDIVHLDPLIGVGEVAISDHRSSQPTLDELLRIASEAHVAGLLAGKAGVVHLHTGGGDRGLDLVRRAIHDSELPPRTFHPTHVNRRRRLFEEALELAEAGGAIDVTAFPPPEDEDDDELTVVEAFRRYRSTYLPDDGLTISSDAGGSLPCFDPAGRVTSMGVGEPAALVGALQDLLAADIPLEEALPPFTSNVAALWRLPRKGRIAAGADADLVVLDAEGAVRDVMARGRWHVRRGETLVRGMFEGPDGGDDLG